MATGIVWAADHAARVVNLSLGGASSSRVLSDAVRYATAHGVLIVAAAGNESGAVGYPARIGGVLGVGAVDSTLARASFSNTGTGLDIVAPGVGIPADDRRRAGQLRGCDAQRDVHGDAVRVRGGGARPGVEAGDDPASVARLLERTAEDLGVAGRDGETGYGLVRADRALGASAD